MDNAITKWLEIGAIVFGLVGIIVLGIVFLPKVMGGFELREDNSFKMVAELKGSIYEGGESMSVFGTCKDIDGNPVTSTAYFSAWYPNGTQFIFDASMMYEGAGIYLWTGTMSQVGGTYLTQIKCVSSGLVAYAYGEWQNPLWVAKINQGLILINETKINTDVALNKLDSLNDTLVMINYTIVDEGNKTRTFVAAEHNYTNYLIEQVSLVANGSVDRNDSLLYYMLYYLMVQAGYPITGNVTVEPVSVPEGAFYYENWTLVIKALDEYNQTISYPAVNCELSSSIAPSFMMTPLGEFFTGTLFIDVLADNFTVDVECTRII